MSQLEVDKIIPQSGTTLTIGDSGDTISFAEGTNLGIDTNTLVIDSTNNRVGIKNASPTVELDVVGDVKVAGDINFGDNDKANFGASNDLQIFHDGTNSVIQDTGTGSLIVKGSNFIRMTGQSNGYTLADFVDTTGEAKLFYQSNLKLATTSTGIDVTGTVVSDGLTVDTNTLYVDSTNNRVGIGTTSPSDTLEVKIGSANTTGVLIHRDNASGGGGIDFSNTSNTVANINVGTGTLTLNADPNNAIAGSYISFKTDDSEAIRIDSSRNVGIGTSSPATKTHIFNGSDNANILFIQGADTTTENIFFGVETGKSTITAGGSSSTNNSLVFRASNAGAETEYMRITNTGNVGIGTSSPTSTLSVKTSAGTLNVEPLGAGAVQLASPTSLGFNIGSGYNYEFDVNGTEAMRIDSSGNLLVGTTTNSNSGQGINIRANGIIKAGATSSEALNLVRLSTNGSMINFYKDTAQVGSIGVDSGDQFYFAAADGMGIKVDSDNTSVEPSNASGVDNDATVNLGAANVRWKDLYLSGNIYLGGSTSANALDDYETGTWTPVFTGETSAGSYTYSFNNGYYTKIGDIVHASFRLINITDVSAGSGNVIITGLPFTVANDGVPNHQSVWTTYFTASTDSDWQLSLDNNTTQFRFRRLNSGTGITMQVSDKTSNLADIYTLFTYRVA